MFNEVSLFTFSKGTHGYDVTVPKNYLKWNFAACCFPFLQNVLKACCFPFVYRTFLCCLRGNGFLCDLIMTSGIEVILNFKEF